MKLFKKLKYLKLAHHIKSNGKVQELKNLPSPTPPEDMDQVTREQIITNYNKMIEQQNKRVDQFHKDVDKQMKKKAKQFDQALFAAAKSNKKYIYVKDLTNVETTTIDYFTSNNPRGFEGYKRIPLKGVRKEMIKLGINYTALSVNAIYEAMTKVQKDGE